MSPNAWVNKCDNMAAHTYIKVQYRAYFMCPTHRDWDRQRHKRTVHTHIHTYEEHTQRTGCRIQEAAHRRHHHHITQINALGRRLSNAELKRRFPRTSVYALACVCVCVCLPTAYDFVIKCCYKQTGPYHAHTTSRPSCII